MVTEACSTAIYFITGPRNASHTLDNEPVHTDKTLSKGSIRYTLLRTHYYVRTYVGPQKTCCYRNLERESSFALYTTFRQNASCRKQILYTGLRSSDPSNITSLLPPCARFSQWQTPQHTILSCHAVLSSHNLTMSLSFHTL